MKEQIKLAFSNAVLNNKYNNLTIDLSREIADISRYIPDSVVLERSAYGKSDELLSQIKSLNDFIANAQVQREVAKDFDAHNYYAFDAKPGDGLCESRAFIMGILLQEKKYEDLSAEEKLVMTLSHIFSKNRIDHRNSLGVLSHSTYMNGAIRYGDVQLPYFDLAVESYKNISTEFLREVSSFTDLTRSASIGSVIKYMDSIQTPIYYLITQLKFENNDHKKLGSTIISSDNKELNLSDINTLGTKPMFICEVVSVVSQKGDKIKKGPLRGPNLNSFEKFVNSVKSCSPNTLLCSAAVLDDRDTRKITASEGQYIAGTGSYKFEGELPTVNAPFLVAHFYIKQPVEVASHVRN